MKIVITLFMFMITLTDAANAQEVRSNDYPIKPVSFSNVKIAPGFWHTRMVTNREVTIPYCFTKCEETGRISNFTKSGDQAGGKFEGIYYNDSDLYKVIEGAAYSLKIHPDAALEKYVDGVIDKIAAAQWEDGYLYTFYSLPERQPEKRWSNEYRMHELYCAGHFFEAAVAYYQATGKKKILDVATKLADKIDSVYGPDGQHDPPGHQEIEIGLARLYHVTDDKKYLELAKFFLDCRGRTEKREKTYGPSSQDHLPVIQQDEAVGHAVRAGYMYAGMADVAALTGDESYIGAIDRIWENVVSRKQYITGGVGSESHGEGFGENYQLPNATAYNETCAAIANAMWNYRLFLLHGDAKYMDVVERVIYNGFLSGVSMSGDRFFYPNPLAAAHGRRSAWFGTSCCPVNVVRFVPSIPGYIYAHRDNQLYVCLFVNGTASVKMDQRTVKLTQATSYPWEGAVNITVDPERQETFSILVRIPGWAQNRTVPSDLYRYMQDQNKQVELKINGKNISPTIEKGFAVIKRTWKKGDQITLSMPMHIRRVLSNEKVKANSGRVAIERGPIVYCAEGIDNGGEALDIVLNDDVKLTSQYDKTLLGGITTISGTLDSENEFTAIPYYAWAHREATQLNVWFARTKKAIIGSGRFSASHTWRVDTVEALGDGEEPKNSNDHSIARFTWWDKKGSSEWIEERFEKPRAVSSLAVYWFDDRDGGACRVPASWEIQYKTDNKWKPVENNSPYGVERHRYNKVIFKTVETTALRVVVTLQQHYSGGILEWKVK